MVKWLLWVSPDRYRLEALERKLGRMEAFLLALTFVLVVYLLIALLQPERF
ncbi:MAG: K(+)-transporting ATPase subunit F [Pseudopedobacter sp.]|nr:K(+)-transporting ATPase subunit F [Deinococcales bacterium]